MIWKWHWEDFQCLWNKKLPFLYFHKCLSRYSASSVQIYDLRRHARSYCRPSRKPQPPFKDTVCSNTGVWPLDISLMRCIWNLSSPNVISLPITAHLPHQNTTQRVAFTGLSVNIRRNKSKVAHCVSPNTGLFLITSRENMLTTKADFPGHVPWSDPNEWIWKCFHNFD